jgi:hypothetical protein
MGERGGHPHSFHSDYQVTEKISTSIKSDLFLPSVTGTIFMRFFSRYYYSI